MWAIWGSLARMGMPDADMSPATTQPFEARLKRAMSSAMPSPWRASVVSRGA